MINYSMLEAGGLMRYVILGGSGLLGSALAEDLTASGHQVAIVSRKPGKVRLSPGVEAAGWDGQSAAGWGQLVDGADGVINLAGESIGTERWSRARKERILRSREYVGQAIVSAVEQARVKPGVVFQVAGVGYYGAADDRIIVEGDPAGTDFLAHIGTCWEDSTLAVEKMGVRRVVARCGVVLTLKTGVLPPMMLPFKLMIGGPLGSGKQWLSWIHLADWVRGVRFLMDNDQAAGIFNLTSPQPLPNTEIGKTLGRVMRRPYWIPAPSFALRLVLGEMSMLVLEGQRVVPKRLVELGFQFRFPTFESALSDLLIRV
jgi:uncharacterized protein (TIGR01777 family)